MADIVAGESEWFTQRRPRYPSRIEQTTVDLHWWGTSLECMNRSIPVAVLSLLVAVSAALTGCSQNEAVSPVPSSTSVTSQEPTSVAPATTSDVPPDTVVPSEVSPDPVVPSETTDVSAMPSSPDAQTPTVIPTYVANDATKVCAELSQEASPILMRALENIEKPSEVSAAYNELADLYEKAVAKVESQDAKDAFASMATAYRNVARDGIGASTTDELNKANEAFVGACFGS